MKRVEQMTAEEILEEVKELDTDEGFKLMYEFITRLHPATRTLPAPLKK